MPKLIVQLFQIGQEPRQLRRISQRIHATQVYSSLPVGVSLVADLLVAFFIHAPSGRHERLQLPEIGTRGCFHGLHQIIYDVAGVRILSFFPLPERSLRENRRGTLSEIQ